MTLNRLTVNSKLSNWTKSGRLGRASNYVDLFFIAPRNLYQIKRYMGKSGTKKPKRKKRSSSSGSSNPSPIEKKLKGFSSEDESHVEGTIATEMSATPGGVLPKKLGRGVRPASQNPYPIYDQNR